MRKVVSHRAEVNGQLRWIYKPDQAADTLTWKTKEKNVTVQGKRFLAQFVCVDLVDE